MNTEQIIEYFKSIFGDNKIYMSNFRGWDFEMLLEHGEFNKLDNVLDTGALHSYFSVLLAQFVNKITTTDDLSWADRDYFAKSGLPPITEWMKIVSEKTNGVVTAEKANIMDLPYSDNTFDKVLSISTIEHVFDDLKGMQELKRVLKPNGLLLMTTEYNEKIDMPFDKEGFLRIYNNSSIENLCQGFKVEMKEFNTTGQSYAGIPFGTLFIKLRKE